MTTKIKQPDRVTDIRPEKKKKSHERGKLPADADPIMILKRETQLIEGAIRQKDRMKVKMREYGYVKNVYGVYEPKTDGRVENPEIVTTINTDCWWKCVEVDSEDDSN